MITRRMSIRAVAAAILSFASKAISAPLDRRDELPEIDLSPSQLITWQERRS